MLKRPIYFIYNKHSIFYSSLHLKFVISNQAVMQLERNVGECVHVMTFSTDHLKKDSTITEQLMAAFQHE